MSAPLLAFENVSKIYQTPRGEVRAVDSVSFDLPTGGVICLVGESGCGKTTSGKMAAALLRPTSGRVLIDGKDINAMPSREFASYRRAIQIIHQDPYASLNPAHTIYGILRAPLIRHKLARGRAQVMNRIIELLKIVDLTPPEDFLFKYPHQLSGGQRQRVSVARALTVNPRLIIADEAVSMVDVSIRVSLLSMMRRLQDDLGVTFVFITHDLAVARYFAWTGRIGVMYLGRMVELGPTPLVIEHPQHPYTKALLSAIPEADPIVTRKKDLSALRSVEVPSLLDLPPGCTYYPRCPVFERGLCDSQVPLLTTIGPRQAVACHVALRERSAAIAEDEPAVPEVAREPSLPREVPHG